MKAIPDRLMRCRCGRATYVVSDNDSLRTCSKCGYLTSSCNCTREGPGPVFDAVRFPEVTDWTRALLGAAVVSSMATLFFITLLISPLLAVLGLGFPVGLTSAFYAKWLRDQVPTLATDEPKPYRLKLVNTR